MMRVLAMSDINWPDGYNYAMKDKMNKGRYHFLKDKPEFTGYQSYEPDNDHYLFSSEHWDIITKPVTLSTIFNKEFRVLGGSNEVWQKCKIVFQGKRYTVVENENGKEFSRKTANITIRDIDTRTDEEKSEADMIEHLTNEGIVTYDNIMLKILIEKIGKIHNVTWGK